MDKLDFLPVTRPGKPRRGVSLYWDQRTAGFRYVTSAGTDAGLGGNTSVQTITAATGTVSATTTLCLVTHATATAITLPALPAAGVRLRLQGPLTSGATAILVAATAGTVEGGADYLKADGYGWEVELESTGSVWRVVVVRARMQVPALDLDLTTASGGSPWSITDGIGGASVTVTDRSTASSSVSASSGLVLDPAASTAVWASNTGAGFSVDQSAAALTMDDEWAILAVYSIGTGWGANEGLDVFAGTTVAATPKAGSQLSGATVALAARWAATTNTTIATVGSTYTGLGLHWDPRARLFRPLSFAVSGSPWSGYWPLDGAKPGGVDKFLADPNALTSSAIDWAGFSRWLVSASNTTDGETWTVTRLVVARILRPTR